MAEPLPTAGLASTYSDKFRNQEVADSTRRKPDIYTQGGIPPRCSALTRAQCPSAQSFA